MVFSSIAFLLGFLPIVLIVYFILWKKARLFFLMTSSLFFYFYGENYLVAIMLLSTIIDFSAAYIIDYGLRIKSIQIISNSRRTRKVLLILSIIANLALLGYFKYSNFFVDTINELITLIGFSSDLSIHFSKVVLPLGISFYTFQSMSYTIDVYRGDVKANRNIIKFATFVTMFPQLVAGPIVRYKDINNELENPSLSIDRFSDGIQRFISGLAKKVFIANSLAIVADRIFEIPANELSMEIAWIGVLAYGFQIYFDFSGYSCMAIGLGKMLGFTFPENFNYPFMSKSITEFWQRWHISLSTWFRDYLYIPLGGNRLSDSRTYVNLMIVFFLCGLWHGANFTFVAFGLYHGIFLVLERMFLLKFFAKIPAILSHVYFFFVTWIGWVIFRSDSLTYASAYLEKMFSFKFENIHLAHEVLQLDTLIAFGLAILFSFPVSLQIKSYLQNKNASFKNAATIFYMAISLIAFVYCIAFIASGSYNPFIYFKF